MLTPKRCTDVSPQCPQGQEEAYRLGWWQGQIDMCDAHDGTPCQVIAMQQEIDALRVVLWPFGQAVNIAKASLGDMADVGHLEAVALRYVSYAELKAAQLIVNNSKEQAHET